VTEGTEEFVPGPGMLTLLGLEIMFDDFRRVDKIEAAIKFSRHGYGDTQLAEIEKVEPGLVGAIMRARRMMESKRLMCERIVVKGKKVKPFCSKYYFDPLPFEYVEEF
jgi:hypothetical protein